MGVSSRYFLGVASILLLSSVAVAQFDVGRITGIVYDSTGAVLPSATVNIKNVGTGMMATVKSDLSGNFIAASLPFGNYIVMATATAFGTATSATLNLNVGSFVNVELRLPLGGAKEQVTVP
jgi:hypothetical protein